MHVDERHLQEYGMVHGGVYASLAETVASYAAALSVMERDPAGAVVGLENHTSFLRAGRPGAELVAEALPIHTGRRTQVWGVVVREAGDDGRELARSSVRLFVLPPGERGVGG